MEKKHRKTKTPSPQQQNRIPYNLSLHQDTSNDHLPIDSGHDDHSSNHLQYCQGPNQFDSSINLQDKVILPKVVTQPTKKPRSVGPNKSIPKKNRNKRKSRLENRKFRSVINPLYGISADHNNNNGLKPPQHLLHKSEDKNTYPLMDTSKSIPIVCWKITKKRSHIVSDISIPG